MQDALSKKGGRLERQGCGGRGAWRALFGLRTQCRCVLTDPPAVPTPVRPAPDSRIKGKDFQIFWGEGMRSFGRKRLWNDVSFSAAYRSRTPGENASAFIGVCVAAFVSDGWFRSERVEGSAFQMLKAGKLARVAMLRGPRTERGTEQKEGKKTGKKTGEASTYTQKCCGTDPRGFVPQIMGVRGRLSPPMPFLSFLPFLPFSTSGRAGYGCRGRG